MSHLQFSKGKTKVFSIFPSWWLNQPIWKICEPSNWIISPGIGVKNKTYLKPPPSFHCVSLMFKSSICIKALGNQWKATISTIDLQRLAHWHLWGVFSGTLCMGIYKNFIQTEGKKIMLALPWDQWRVDFLEIDDLDSAEYRRGWD